MNSRDDLKNALKMKVVAPTEWMKSDVKKSAGVAQCVAGSNPRHL
jgi:hypothetical protein